jgi:PIF1-like helicase
LHIYWPEHERRLRIVCDLHRRLRSQNKSVCDYGLPEPELDEPALLLPILEHLPPHMQLTRDQQAVFDTVAAHLDDEAPEEPMLVHIEGEAGGSKSTVLRALLAYARSKRRMALPAAFPAKVANTFQGGQTAHCWTGLTPSKAGAEFQFKLQTPGAGSLQSGFQRRAHQLQTACLIFIDEITMMRRDELDAIVDKLDTLHFCGTFQTSSQSCGNSHVKLPRKFDSMWCRRLRHRRQPGATRSSHAAIGSRNADRVQPSQSVLLAAIQPYASDWTDAHARSRTTQRSPQNRLRRFRGSRRALDARSAVARRWAWRMRHDVLSWSCAGRRVSCARWGRRGRCGLCVVAWGWCFAAFPCALLRSVALCCLFACSAAL